MKKFLTMIVAIVASMFVGMTTTSCGDDWDDTIMQYYTLSITGTYDGETVDPTQYFDDDTKAKLAQFETTQMTESKAHSVFNTATSAIDSSMKKAVAAAKAEGHTVSLTMKLVGKTTGNTVGEKTWE